MTRGKHHGLYYDMLNVRREKIEHHVGLFVGQWKIMEKRSTLKLLASEQMCPCVLVLDKCVHMLQRELGLIFIQDGQTKQYLGCDIVPYTGGLPE